MAMEYYQPQSKLALAKPNKQLTILKNIQNNSQIIGVLILKLDRRRDTTNRI